MKSIVLSIIAAVIAMVAVWLLYSAVLPTDPPAPERVEVIVASNISQESLLELEKAHIRGFEQDHSAWSITLESLENAEIRRRLHTLQSPDVDDNDNHSIYPVFSDTLLSQLIQQNLLQPLNDVVTEQHLRESLNPVLHNLLVSNGRPYVVPYRWNYWGIWYNTELLAAAGVQPPESLDDLKEIATVLQGSGITPFAVGGGFGWSVEAWFDYLYVRSYGFEQHQLLSSGEIPFHDDSVGQTLHRLSEMINNGWFAAGSERMNWLEAVEVFESGEAAMYLMGDFLWDRLSLDTRRRTGFFPFPAGRHNDSAELISLEGWAVPSTAAQFEGAVAYLQYRFSAASIQEFAARSGSNPVRSDAIPAFLSERQRHAMNHIAPAEHGFPLFSRRVPEHMDPGTRFARLFANPTPDGIDAFINSMEERRVAGQQ